MSTRTLTHLTGDTPEMVDLDPVPATAETPGQAPSSFGGASTPMTQTLYLTEAGDKTAINVDDLHQGQMGDCFLISSMGELALFHSSTISNDIKLNANGTETVTLFEGSNGSLPWYGTTSYKPVAVTVSNVFPSYSVDNAANQDVVGAQKEIWAQVLEKAVATLNGGYGGIANGGNPGIAMEELTGKAATLVSPSAMTAAKLGAYAAAGSLMVFDTANSGSLPYGLVGNHAYMFEKVTTTNGVASVQLGNPWGYDQPVPVPVSQLSKAFVEIDVGRAT